MPTSKKIAHHTEGADFSWPKDRTGDWSRAYSDTNSDLMTAGSQRPGVRIAERGPGVFRRQAVDERENLAMPSLASRSYGVADESGEVVSVVEGPAVEEGAGEVLAGAGEVLAGGESAGEVLVGGVEAAELATMGLGTGSDDVVVPG
jgi:hypothetical protein